MKLLYLTVVVLVLFVLYMVTEVMVHTMDTVSSAFERIEQASNL